MHRFDMLLVLDFEIQFKHWNWRIIWL